MTRPRAKPIKVWVTEAERDSIARLAASANLSLSAYLRAAGLNQAVRSFLDVQAVTELAKVNGDLGRLAVLLKAVPIADVRRTIEETRELQTKLLNIMGSIIRK